jgi:hypothetical protein
MLCSCKTLTIIRVALTNPSVASEFLANMAIVLIFRLVYVAVNLMVTNCSETQYDRAVRATYIRNLQSLHCSKS